MREQIKLVVFDMAGTTVKDRNYVGVAFQQAMQSMGYELSIERVNPFMGYEKPVAIRRMLNEVEASKDKITADLVSKIHSEFVKRMIDFYSHTDDIAALPNVEQTFERLRSNGIKVALNTGFSRDIADVIIERLDWASKIDCLVASDQVAHGRPFPDMIKQIMMQLEVHSGDQVAKVGDTEVDINEGINAGCQFVIGITTGSFTREQLLPYQPTHIIDDISDIIEIIFGGTNNTTETAQNYTANQIL
ncbi:HAD hydrolase-like protein [Dyadobacter sp. LJ53]|uniref:HAD hydrolase-like protein n=1 Tax=Dyadobacter chenwenxiniae TaxID=2906456 RepID=UPI001F1F3ADD|nr:HAD hydrolase-like protein [Dyadobacter chenwenxiniae]MCF0051713.1 HAD hydrolase-like protein [Dyadobacter chenwenxiniae]